MYNSKAVGLEGLRREVGLGGDRKGVPHLATSLHDSPPSNEMAQPNTSENVQVSHADLYSLVGYAHPLTFLLGPFPENLVFSGGSGTDCERFLVAVRRHALMNGKQRDYEWIVDLVACCLVGDALVSSPVDYVQVPH